LIVYDVVSLYHYITMHGAKII